MAMICVPSPRPVIIPDEAVAERAAETPLPPAEVPAPDPEDAPAETIIAALEGEEPLVVDAGMDAPAPEKVAPEESIPEESTPEEPAPEESTPEESTPEEPAPPEPDKPEA